MNEIYQLSQEKHIYYSVAHDYNLHLNRYMTQKEFLTRSQNSSHFFCKRFENFTIAMVDRSSGGLFDE